ncbi:MAG TPA: lysophospholipid acyltransferase family protein [Prolixibacteraceae bacterium]|nr:lysophospholipid acyltransferase family protein [Prolixibacteraceae bacterium]
MKKNAGYTLIRLLTLPMQLFPLEFHYGASAFLFFLMYHVFRYRRVVVEKNLAASFPEKSGKERKRIGRDFYRSFAAMFIETLYFIHINVEKEAQRLNVQNAELIDCLLHEGKNVVLMGGHFGNWEFFQLFTRKLDANRFYVYKKIRNEAFDRLYRDLRARGATPLEMNETYRRLLSEYRRKQKFIAFFISDQRPIPEDLRHWIPFMKQDTPIMTGTEKIARKTDAAVVYTEIRRIKRGVCLLRFDLITENSTLLPPLEITRIFFQKLEESIRSAPEQYLWTHKRWKYQRKPNA